MSNDNRGHLTLTRRTGEALLLTIDGDEIVIRVREIAGQRVRIAIDAPHRVAIHREEVKLLPRRDVEALEQYEIGGEAGGA